MAGLAVLAVLCLQLALPASARGPLPLPDTDRDDVPDAYDNCPSFANARQEDMDRDGIGDVCDPDLDGDGVVDKGLPGTLLDDCPRLVNRDQLDTGGSSDGNLCKTPDANLTAYPTQQPLAVYAGQEFQVAYQLPPKANHTAVHLTRGVPGENISFELFAADGGVWGTKLTAPANPAVYAVDVTYDLGKDNKTLAAGAVRVYGRSFGPCSTAPSQSGSLAVDAEAATHNLTPTLVIGSTSHPFARSSTATTALFDWSLYDNATRNLTVWASVRADPAYVPGFADLPVSGSHLAFTGCKVGLWTLSIAAYAGTHLVAAGSYPFVVGEQPIRWQDILATNDAVTIHAQVTPAGTYVNWTLPDNGTWPGVPQELVVERIPPGATHVVAIHFVPAANLTTNGTWLDVDAPEGAAYRVALTFRDGQTEPPGIHAFVPATPMPVKKSGAVAVLPVALLLGLAVLVRRRVG